MVRISVSELRAMIAEGAQPVILDSRSTLAPEAERRRIPGAIPVELDAIEGMLEHVPPGRDVVVYCSCPNEASAARVARLMMDKGFVRVRPLQGGIEAWIAAGHEAVDSDAVMQ